MGTTTCCLADVAVGEALPSIVKGPWTTAHIIRWHIAQENLERFHYDQRFATEVWGLPGVVANGNWRKYCIAQLCKDWIGYDGWVWRLFMRYTRMQRAGDVLTVWGRVAKAYERDGLGFVEVEAGMRNQDGEETTPSYAVLVVPLRPGEAVLYPFVPPAGLEVASPFRRGRTPPEPYYLSDEVHRSAASLPPSDEVECWDDVSRSDLRRLALGIPDHDPIYWDEPFARATRFGTLVAPPVYPVDAFKVPPSLPDQLTERLRRDPSYPGFVGDPRLRLHIEPQHIHPELTVLLNGGQEYEIFRLLHLGEKCRARTSFVDLYEKQGSSGRFVVSVFKTEYRTPAGEPVMRAYEYRIVAPRGVGARATAAVPVGASAR